MRTNLHSLVVDICSHKKPVQWPLSVSYHGDSTILVGSDGQWATGNVLGEYPLTTSSQVNCWFY